MLEIIITFLLIMIIMRDNDNDKIPFLLLLCVSEKYY